MLHADDIRTLSNNLSSMEAQITAVTSFTSETFLQLNVSKCEIVTFEKSRTSAPSGALINCSFPMKNEGKCFVFLMGIQSLLRYNDS